MSLDETTVDTVPRVYGATGQISVDRRITMRMFRWLAVMLLFGFGLVAAKSPLTDVHWDSVFYLYKSKLLAETPVYRGYIEHADQIAREVMEDAWDKELSYFPQPYWYFTRLGHLTTLAAFVALGHNGRESLLFAHFGYGFMWVLSFALLSFLAMQLTRFLSVEREHVVTGAVASAALFLASGQSWHMIGNLVAEVPALFFVAIALNALVACQLRKSWGFAALAAVSTFIVYACRTDFLWIVLTFGSLLAVAPYVGITVRVWYRGLFAAGALTLALYAGYAALFYPLGDPRVFLHFWSIVRAAYQSAVPPDSFARLWIVAGGLLWIGALLALPAVRERSLARFGLLWLLLLALPWILQALAGGWAQARMLTAIVPALFVLSAAGWSQQFERLKQKRNWPRAGMIGAVLLLLLLVTYQHSYDALRILPGAWRLQYVRSYLRPDKYEQRDYPVENLARISSALYGDRDLKVVVLAPSANKDVEYVNLIRFFGPPHAPDRDLFAFEPQKVWRKGIEPRADDEYVVFKNYMEQGDVEGLKNGSRRLFFLTKDGAGDALGYARWKFAVTPTVDKGEYRLLEATRELGKTD
jgi:hypothetical protein